MKYMYISLLLIIIPFIYGCQTITTSADLVLLNARVYTVSEPDTIYDALAVRNDKILIVDCNEKVKSFINKNTHVIDLQGSTVLPGFIDSHAHFMNLGYFKMKLILTEIERWSDLLTIVKKAVDQSNPGEWIEGRGWHQEKLEKLPEPIFEEYPVHDQLSAVSPNNPVYLKHRSGHAVLVNKKAMTLAGIDRHTKDPEGGKIIRDNNGNPTGIFLENAKYLIEKKLTEDKNKLSKNEIEKKNRQAFQNAVNTCLANGITSFHDAGVKFKEIEFYKKLIDENKSPIRLWVMIKDSLHLLRQHLPNYRILNYGDYQLTVRAIKSYMDGALGSRGAWLLKPYTDQISTSGMLYTPLNELTEIARLAIENDFQFCIHAIGDRGNRELLDLYESTFKKYPQNKDLRWRSEHAQHLHPDDIQRFYQLGVIAAMQGIHCTSDGSWVPKRLGEKRSKEGAYVWKDLINAGVLICNGTDAPVEDIDPLENFHATITRELPDGTSFYPEQTMTRNEALRSYTINAAYAAFEENIKGTLTPGKLADIVVLSKDIMTIPVNEILTTEVLYTIIGGRILYNKNN